MQPFLFVRREGRFARVDFRDIVYIEAKKNNTRVMLDDKSSVLVLGTLKQWERLLPSDLFCRIHRGYIVSIEKIVAFDNKHVYLPGSEIITIGDQYRNALPDSVVILAHEPVREHSRAPLRTSYLEV